MRSREFWSTLLGLLVTLGSASWFAVNWPGAAITPWQPVLSELMIRRDAGDAVLQGRSFYAITPHGWYTGTPFEAALTAVTNVIAPLPAMWLWTALTALVIFGLCHRLGLRGWLLALVAAATCSLQPLHATLGTGHHAVVLAGLVLFDLWPTAGSAPRWRRLTTGIGTGVAIAIDPTFAVFALTLLLCRRFRPALTALATGAALTVTTAAVLPAMSVRYLLEVLPKQYDLLDFTGKVNNQSVVSAVVRLFGPSQNALLLGQLCALAIALAAAVAAAGWLRRGLAAHRRTNSGSTAVTGPALPAPAVPFALAVAGLGQVALTPIVTGPQLVWALVLGATCLWLPPVRIPSLLVLLWTLAVPWSAIDTARTWPDLGALEQVVAGGQVLLLAVAVGAALAAVVPRLRPAARSPEFGNSFTGDWGRPERFGWAIPLATVVFGLFTAASYLQPLHELSERGSFRTPDFLVYIRAAHAYADGTSIYAYRPPEEWPFLYPPIAAVLAQPLGWLPLVVVQVGWTLLTLAALLWLTHRILPNRPRWAQGLVCALAVICLGPIDSTLGLGQVSILLMVLTIADVMPTKPSERLLGKGYLLGLATAIKLTPGAFIVYLWFIGRRRAAIVSGSVFAGLSLLGFAFAPGQSWQYWTKIATGSLQFYPDTRGALHNQSVLSLIQRLVGLDRADDTAWTIICIALTALALIVGILVHRRGYALLGVSICGLTALLAVPVAWTHYYVWTYPLLLAIVYRRSPSSAVRAAALALVGWMVTQPFWTLGDPGRVPGNDQLHYEFDFTPSQHLVAGGSALLVVAVVVSGLVALLRGRREHPADPVGTAGDLALTETTEATGR